MHDNAIAFNTHPLAVGDSPYTVRLSQQSNRITNIIARIRRMQRTRLSANGTATSNPRAHHRAGPLSAQRRRQSEQVTLSAAIVVQPKAARNGESTELQRVATCSVSSLDTDQRQTYAPFTSTRWSQAAPTVAAPTAAPPTTARRVVRRATPAPLKGVKGRPTRACALVANSERPSVCDQSSEPKTPQVMRAMIHNARFKRA
jgi:hypothetical protein